MEQFCRSLHPDLGLSPTCLSWFEQATEHCTDVILRTKSSSQFWNTVKNLIFPERNTGLLNQNIPIAIHPNRLSMQDCHFLFLDIVNDYIQRAPRYSAEAATNMLLWQILYSLMGIMALGSVLVSTIFGYQKYGRILRSLEKEDIIFAPEKCVHACVKRNMRIVKYELQRLRVQHMVQPEELFAPDGTASLVLRLTTKVNFFDQIITCQEQAIGRLYRLHELMGKKNPIKPDFKVETITKALKFLNNYSRKLHIIVVFDDEPLYEQLVVRKRKNASPMRYSPPKLQSSPPLPAATPLSHPPSMRKLGSTLSYSNTPQKGIPRSVSPVKTRLFSPRQTQIPHNFSRRSSCVNIKK